MSSAADVYEKLGTFYLGRRYDLGQRTLTGDLVLYDSKDLVTHAVIVGMTGSGKTGLGLGLLEEAAIDRIPALIVDPKGDLTNLLLQFPELRASDFAPWVNEDDARRQGMTREEYARGQAKLWSEGLAQWDQDGQRIARLREAADFAIYTPGSDAGLPVSILSSFAAPPAAVLAEGDLLRDRISTTATSLLALLGVSADPIRSREHILLTTILDNAWRQGRQLDLGSLIQLVQNPPVSRIGVLDLESFYPSRDRFELAMTLNNLLAAPGFSAWLSGEPLDVDRLLYTPGGKPRLSIFSISHLSESERMFFVSLLLNQTLGWMRSLPGTTSLRALLYIDELFGYMPPVSEPPSKRPLLTLLKQARAYGLGVVLATQNPVDLDYKGLSNTGTWFLGRLQTDRDKQRVLDGLEGVCADTGSAFDRTDMSSTLSALGKRVFLMHNVHESEPVVFQTRWALTYLAGPMTRAQIKQLMDGSRGAVGPAEPALAGEASAPSGPGPSGAAAAGTAAAAESIVPAAPRGSVAPSGPGAPAAGRGTVLAPHPRPVLAPEIAQVFLPVRGTRSSAELWYEPRLLALVKVHFVEARKGLSADEELVLLAGFPQGPLGLDWAEAVELQLAIGALESEPAGQAGFGDVPAEAGQPRSYDGWKRSLADYLYRVRRYNLYYSENLKEYSRPGENERDFRLRIAQRAREQRDLQVEKLRRGYAPKLRRLEEKVRKAELTVEREQKEASGAKMQSAISFGATLLSAVLGRKVMSGGTLGRATTAVRGAGRVSQQADDVRRAAANLVQYQQELHQLEEEFAEAADNLASLYDPLQEPLVPCQLKPRKTDILIRTLTLAWVPFGRDPAGALVPLCG